MCWSASILGRGHAAERKGPAYAFEAVFFEALEPRMCLSALAGIESLVNGTTVNTQDTAGPVAVAAAPSGDFVAVWESLGQDLLGTWGVYGRLYNADGTPKGPEFLVNANVVAGDERRPTVACDSAGGFIVAWDGAGLAGLLPSIYAQRYDSGGVAQGAAITVSLGSLAQPRTDPVVAISVSGAFIVTWESMSQDALLTSGVYARLFTANGTAVSGAFAVNQTTAGDQSSPIAAADSSGNFVVAWSGQGTGDSDGIFIRRFSATGAALSSEQRVNSTTAGAQSNPAIATSPAGSVMVAWDGAGPGDAAGIFAQRFDALLLPVGGETAINDQAPGTQSGAAVSFDSDGDCVVAWSGNGLGDVDGVFAREFDAEGNPRAASSLVNTTTAGSQLGVSIAASGNNSYVLTWSGAGVGDADGVFGRMMADQPPVVSTAAVPLAYSEGAGPVAIDSALTLADPDDATLAGASVALGAGYAAGEDQLGFTNQFGIVGSWDPASGVLTLSGTAALSAYQAALRSVTYENLSNDPSTVARTVVFRVSDGSDLSAPTTRTINVGAVNDPPVVITSAGALAYTEGEGPLEVDSGLVVSDVDSALLTEATVSITGGYAQGEDLLAFTDQNGISGSWDAFSGMLTLAGAAGLAAYQTALRSVQYTNTSENPSTLTRTVMYVVLDGTAPSAPAARALSVAAVNDPPVVNITNSPLSYTENSGLVVVDGGLTIDDVDSAVLGGGSVRISSNYAPGEDVLGFTDQFGIEGSWDAAAGILTLMGAASVAQYQTALRSVTYSDTSDNPSIAQRTMSFIVTDGADPSLPGVRSVNIATVNDPPTVVASPGALSYPARSGAVPVDTGLSVSDIDSVFLQGASVAISGNYVFGEDTLAFVNQSGISGVWNSLSGTLTLTGAASVAAYQAALRSVTFSDNALVPLTPDRTISFVVTDGSASSPAATRLIAVGGVNTPPVVVTTPGVLVYAENAGPLAVDPGLLVTDLENAILAGATISLGVGYARGEDLLAFVDQSGISGEWDAAAGVLTLTGIAPLGAYQAALRSVTYANTSENPSVLPRPVSFVVSDGTSPSTPAVRGIAVVAINDPPVAIVTGSPLAYPENAGPLPVDPALTLEDVDSPVLTGASVTITGNYSPGEDLLTFAPQSGIVGVWDPIGGRLTLTGVATVAAYEAVLRSVAYTDSSENPSPLTRAVTFIASDLLSSSQAASRAIHVTAVNDAPVVIVLGISALYVENSAPVLVAPFLTITDADSTLLAGATVTISDNFAAAEDALLFSGQGGITGSWNAVTGVLTLFGSATLAAYEAALRTVAYFNASDNPTGLQRAVTFIASDGLAASAPAATSVNVLGVNDLPVVVTTPGSSVFTEGGGPVTVDPSLTIADADSATLTGASITISGNYAPGEDSLSLDAQPGILAVWDPIAGILTLTGVASISSYQSALRSVSYADSSLSPSTRTRTVSIRVTDGVGFSSPAVRGIIVAEVNSPPEVTTGANPLLYTEDDGAIAIDPALAVTDRDSVVLTLANIWFLTGYNPGQDMLSIETPAGLVSSWNGDSGVLTLSGASGVAVYEAALRSAAYANASENPGGGPRVIGFAVSDGTDSSTTGTKTVFVLPVNDAPVITGLGPLSFIENQAATPVAPGLLLADPDSPSIAGATIQIIGQYARGEDILAIATAGGIVAAWDAESGTLTLSGPATLEQYAAALQSVTYSNTSDAPSTAQRILAIRVTDGQALGSPAEAEISISAVNDPPELTMTLSQLDYDAGGSPAPIDEGVRVTDVDNTSLVGATVAIRANYAPGDELLFEDRNGIRGRWDAGAGVLTLSGVASVDAYQAALRSVRFRTAAETTMSDSRSVAVTVNDGAASVSAGRLVTVSIPTPPVVTPPVSPPSPPVAPPSVPPPVTPPVSQPLVSLPPVTLPPIPPEAIPPATPPAAPPPTPQSGGPPSVEPPSNPQPTNQPQPVARIVVDQASASTPSASLHIDPASLAAAAGTAIQLIESPGVVRSLGLTDLSAATGLRARLTTAVVGVGGSLGAAYVVWLLVNYSLARYSLLLLPSFDPLDLYCLLSLAKRERRLAN